MEKSTLLLLLFLSKPKVQTCFTVLLLLQEASERDISWDVAARALLLSALCSASRKPSCNYHWSPTGLEHLALLNLPSLFRLIISLDMRKSWRLIYPNELTQSPFQGPRLLLLLRIRSAHLDIIRFPVRGSYYIQGYIFARFKAELSKCTFYKDNRG